MKGGGDIAIWRIRLEIIGGKKLVDSLVNFNGDVVGAGMEAMSDGVELDALYAAPELGDVLVRVREMVEAVRAGATSSVPVVASRDVVEGLGIGAWEGLEVSE